MRHLMFALFTLTLISRLQAQEFERDVGPLLVRRCLECHGGPQPKGKLDLTTRAAVLKGGKNGPAVVPGDLKASELWARVDAGEMPPRKPLSADEKKILRAWIESGAAWGSAPLDLFAATTAHRAGLDWWSLQPVALALARPEVPTVKKSGWARNPIDHFVLNKLEAKGLGPTAEADRRTLIRRLSFDLNGLPPSPEEVEAFLRDPRADAYEKLVDRLLDSPHHGERWARHWLDVVRFGESHGFEHDELRRNAWPYRDWVIQAFNHDMPYDEFVRQQIAGDLMPATTAAGRKVDLPGLAATGFLVAGGFDSVGQSQQSAAMKAVVRQDELEDMLSTYGQTFLGLTVHCARCHDHKFDPIRQVEYYRLAATLAGVHHGERPLPLMKDQGEGERLLRLQRLKAAQEELARLEGPVRAEILASRKKSNDKKPVVPGPLAHWDFTRGLDDKAGNLHAQLKGDARQTAAGLQLFGTGYALSPPIARDLSERTLTAWVKLANLDQRGGAAVSLETEDGSVFDAIVFGEKEPRKWLAGSDFFRRSANFAGSEETQADTHAVHLAMVYRGDGSIICYRNGVPYGNMTKPPGPITFRAGKARLLFGLRHSPAMANKLLTGVVVQAELYDRALSAEEAASLAGGTSQFISEEMLLEKLSAEAKKRRTELRTEIANLSKVTGESARGKVYAALPLTPERTFLLLRGEPGRKGAELTAGGLQALSHSKKGTPTRSASEGSSEFGLDFTASDAQRRLKLAEWTASPNNPLLARVMVNRLWHHHFGSGIVDTPSDFGFNGGRPSHPELLDWLAGEFMAGNEKGGAWSLKKMHRLIVTSATYRQGSRFNAAAAKIDANNRLLWRKSPQRLDAEAVRDAVLSSAGKLNLTMGGAGYQDFKLTIRGNTYYYAPLDSDAPEQMRRSIYRTWVRSGRSPLLDSLDCPDPSTATPRRAVTTTPLQALSLLNSDFMLRMIDHFAQRLERDGGKDTARQITLAYSLALGRPPSAAELGSASRVVEEHGIRILCRALFNCNEFMYVD